MRDHPVKTEATRKPQGRKPSKFWRLPFKKREFVRHFLACDLDEVEAARRANWANPEKDGPRLLRSTTVTEAIEEQGKDINLGCSMGPEEARRRVAKVARTEEHPQHLKALDMILRTQGQYIDKVTVELSRTELLSELQAELDKLDSPNVIEAEYTSSESSSNQPLLVEKIKRED